MRGALENHFARGWESMRDLPLPSECEGCGEEKTYRGRPAQSLIVCGVCSRKVPRWLWQAFWNEKHDGFTGPSRWETRIREFLRWMGETNDVEGDL